MRLVLASLALVGSLAASLPWVPSPHPAIVPVFSASFSSSTTPERGPSATFTRATASTKCVAGVVSSVSSGSAVIGQPIASNGTCGTTGGTGVYVGAATTFRALNNETFTGWTSGAHVTLTASTNDVTDPSGGNTAAKAVCASCTNAEALTKSAAVAVTASQTHTCTAWVRSASGTQAFRQAITETGVTTWLTSDLTASTTWKKFVFTHAFTTGTSATCEVDGATAGGSYTLYIWRPELVTNRSFAVPLDPAVAGSTVAVNAENISYAASVPSPMASTVCAWINPLTTANIDFFAWNSTHDVVLQTAGGVGKIGWTINGLADGPSVVSNSTLTVGSWQQVCWAVNETTADVRLLLNGVEGSYLATDRTWSAGGVYGTTLFLNYSNPNADFVSNARVYGRALTNGQILALYNASAASYAQAPRNPLRDWMLASLPAFVADKIAPSNAEIVAGAKWRVAHDPALQASWTMPEGG